MNDYIMNYAVSEFRKYYTDQLHGKEDYTTEDEYLFDKLCSLKTRTQHDISMIFFAGFSAGVESCKKVIVKNIDEIFETNRCPKFPQIVQLKKQEPKNE